MLLIAFQRSSETVNAAAVVASINLLLQYAANPNFRNNSDRTPLTYITCGISR